MGFSDYLKDVEREMATIAKPVVAPIAHTKKPVILKRAVVEEVVEEDDCLDEYLLENAWKFRNDAWVDPITRNRLVYEAAYAVQQERDRVSVVAESAVRQDVSRSVARPQQQQSIMSYAANVLSEDGETLYENDSIAHSAMYSNVGSQYDVPVGDVEQSQSGGFYGGEEARMLAEAEAQAFSDGASMSGGVSSSRSNGDMMNHASALF